METMLLCRIQRLYDRDGGPYLLTLHEYMEFNGSGLNRYIPCPQARAVMDDFGFLAIVRGWL